MTTEHVLITGVTGYIGFKVLRIALTNGNRVRAVVRKEEQIAKVQHHPRLAGLTDNLEFVIVPDLAITGAFDESVKGVTVIIHLASPLARETDDYVRDIVQPALDIETQLLTAALATCSVRRVVITSSAVTLMPMSWLASDDTKTVFTAKHLNTETAPPYNNSMEAYWASKALARKHVHAFLLEKLPHFDIVQLLPTVVFGPDDWAIDLETFFVGTRSMIVPIVQGKKVDMALVGAPVLVDDLAQAHIDAISPSVPGNKDYILSSEAPEGIEWNSVLDIAQKHFPQEVKDGLLQCTGSLRTKKWMLDVSETEKAFGRALTSFEETVRRQLEQYIALLRKSKLSTQHPK